MTAIKDKKGFEVKPFDLLKVYHFTGARRKKHYMYKWVLPFKDKLYCQHLEKPFDFEEPWKSGFLLSAASIGEFEIIQGIPFERFERRK